MTTHYCSPLRVDSEWEPSSCDPSFCSWPNQPTNQRQEEKSTVLIREIHLVVGSPTFTISSSSSSSILERVLFSCSLCDWEGSAACFSRLKDEEKTCAQTHANKESLRGRITTHSVIGDVCCCPPARWHTVISDDDRGSGVGDREFIRIIKYFYSKHQTNLS